MEFSHELDRETAAVARALKERDLYTAEHCGRVEGLALDLGKACALTPAELRLLAFTARLHDIGKIGIPDHILLKPGRLDDDEMTVMKSHAERGCNILQAIDDEEIVAIAKTVLHHHEAFDGTGYPAGLAGEDIPVLSRIVAIADSYDAMATDRPYHRGRMHADIMHVMFEENSGKYDAYLGGRFAAVIAGSPFRAG